MKYGTIERVIYDSRHFYDLNMICYTTYKQSWMEKLRLFFKRNHYVIIEGYYIRYKYLNHKDGLAAYILDYHFINNREIKNETLEYIDLCHKPTGRKDENLWRPGYSSIHKANGS